MIIYLIVKKNRIKKKKDNEISRIKIEYLFKNNLKQKIIKLKFPNLLYNECPICLENIKENDKVSYTPCKHIFHFDCLKNWLETEALNPQCPNCKYSILSNVELNYINLNDNNGNNNIRNGNRDNCSEHVVIHNVRNIENNNGQSNNNGNN